MHNYVHTEDKTDDSTLTGTSRRNTARPISL